MEQMNKHAETLYAQHLRALKLRSYSASTIDVYAHAVRRLTDYFDSVPDQINVVSSIISTVITIVDMILDPFPSEVSQSQITTYYRSSQMNMSL